MKIETGAAGLPRQSDNAMTSSWINPVSRRIVKSSTQVFSVDRDQKQKDYEKGFSHDVTQLSELEEKTSLLLC
jgi:hypothetical protein